MSSQDETPTRINDELCPNCGALGQGLTPDTHPCMDNLIEQADDIKEEYNPGGFQDLTGIELDLLSKAERSLSRIYTHMQAIVQFYSDEAERVQRIQSEEYNKKQNARLAINQLRSEIRLRFEPEID